MPRNARKSVHDDEMDVNHDDPYGGDMGGFGEDMEDMMPLEEQKLVPEDQIKGLDEEQLNEVFTKGLNATDPNAQRTITQFHYKDGQFKLVRTVDNLATHFSMDGTLVFADSDEAKDQQQHEKEREVYEAEKKKAIEEGLEEPSTRPGGKALKNQFNYSDRAAQTFNNPLRDREVATEPPPTANFSANATQWVIFDEYAAEMEKQNANKDKGGKKGFGKDGDEKPSGPLLATDEDEEHEVDLFSTGEMARSLKIMERMVNQNFEAECFSDYKYFEDKNEHKREDGTGTFFPLWRFTYEKAKRKTVTSMCWNPEFTDLFAVGFGSYDFMRQGPGLINCYALKNTSFPEYTFETTSGVMCLDFHPQHSSLLVAGLYDGTIVIYDVRLKTGNPIYTSSDPKVKHTDPVWQVHWAKEEPGKNINLYSISSDGRVTNWIMNKNELANDEVVALKLEVKKDEDEPEDEEDPTMVGLAGGCCFDFNKKSEHMFIVGTEEGAIHAFSKAFNTQYLTSYEGHHMSVYTTSWNHFHPTVFLSCSADWTVKLWEANTKKPVMTFDLGSSVSDVAWAPFSSTVFAVITADGMLRLYDLNVNKHEPIGETLVNKKAPLTHISFNPTEPIICVGDDRGVVNTFKLSGNLHKMTAPNLEDIDNEEEVEKLDRLLIIEDEEGGPPKVGSKKVLPTSPNVPKLEAES